MFDDHLEDRPDPDADVGADNDNDSDDDDNDDGDHDDGNTSCFRLLTSGWSPVSAAPSTLQTRTRSRDPS